MLKDYKDAHFRTKLTDLWRYLQPNKDEKEAELQPRTKLQKLILGLKHQLLKAFPLEETKVFCLKVLDLVIDLWKLNVEKANLDELKKLLN
jgi:hypothetical protein